VLCSRPHAPRPCYLWALVQEDIRVYKEALRKHIPAPVPFYPLGTSDVTDAKAPVVLGMRSPGETLLAVWRVDGPATTRIRLASRVPKLLYPTDPGVRIASAEGALSIQSPRTRMACLVAIWSLVLFLRLSLPIFGVVSLQTRVRALLGLTGSGRGPKRPCPRTRQSHRTSRELRSRSPVPR